MAQWPVLAVDECEVVMRACHGEFAALLPSMDDADLAREFRYTNVQGHTFDVHVADALVHVPLHSQHHRAQIAAALRAAGAEPAATDFVAFTRRRVQTAA
jgi:uncharacterized damage-inducible protein DinB